MQAVALDAMLSRTWLSSLRGIMDVLLVIKARVYHTSADDHVNHDAYYFFNDSAKDIGFISLKYFLAISYFRKLNNKVFVNKAPNTFLTLKG